MPDTDFAYVLLNIPSTNYTPGTGDVDLSPFFGSAPVTDTSYQNISWALVDVQTNQVFHQGAVNPDGTLAPDDGSGRLRSDGTLISTLPFPAPYIFRDPFGYLENTQLQIIHKPDPDKCCKCQQDPSAQKSCQASDDSGNSVELATGRFVFQKQLVSLAGVGSGNWSFNLNYKANYSIDGLLGKGFAYSQYMRLELLANTYESFVPSVQLVTNELTRVIFTPATTTYYTDMVIYTPLAESNVGATLAYYNYGGTGYTGNGYVNATDIFVLLASDGTVTIFSGFGSSSHVTTWPAPGQIQKIADRFGNSQAFLWDVSNEVSQLQSVTDSYGRKIQYEYYEQEGGYHVRQITDFLGRQLNFQYDEFDHLIAVVSPSILKAAPGNTFPGGTAYVFQYDVNNGNPARRDDLVKIWYPNQTQTYLDTNASSAGFRTVDVQAVYENAPPRYSVTYGQNFSDLDTYGKVLTETLGDPENGVGGTEIFNYSTCSDDLPSNLIDPDSPIVSQTSYTDHNGNRTIYDFNANWTISRMEVQLNRLKNSLELTDQGGVATPPFITWTAYNDQNLPVSIIYPEGNSIVYTYETGEITGVPNPYVARRGLLLSETLYPGNSHSLPNRSGSSGQTILTKRYFYEPLFNQLCAVIEERGNPIDGTTYFTPQNGGASASDTNRDRYTTLYAFDYQKDTAATVTGDVELQTLLGLNSTQIQALITFVDGQMRASGTGGITTGFPMGLGGINGDGTGNGASSGLPPATHLGNVVRITHPPVLLAGGATQSRVELFTINLRGQVTTVTDPEGNITVTVRYPENDPEGSGQNASFSLSSQQYGLIREIHRDANPDDVMSLVGASGDLVAFMDFVLPAVPTPRYNTPSVYQDLITRYEGSSSGSAGCVTCGYDAMGNVLNETDPRGFTKIYDRNEMGEIYRVTSPIPYDFRVETFYDANRNVIQIDTEDLQVRYNSNDPTASGYGTFTPSGSGSTAHVPMVAGVGGILRPGWFSNLMSYDLIDNKIEEDIDATGSIPPSLITRYEYDANQNLIKVIKPEGNTVEFDYDERNLKIVERVGYYLNPDDPTDPANSLGAVTAYSYDGNKNLLNIIGPVDHNMSGTTPGLTSLTVYITDGFGSGKMLTQTGDWVLQNIYDGFDRVVTAADAVGGVVNTTYDPTSAPVQKQTQGAAGGLTPTDHSGTGNVTLANAVMRYDEASRLYEQQQDVFLVGTGGSGYAITHFGGGLLSNSTNPTHTDPAILTAGQSSYVLSRTVYDRAGRISQTLSDNAAATQYQYDGANREILTIDPLGNSVDTQYDGNGNPVNVTRTEVCTITTPAVGNEIFVSFTWFDCMNRPVVIGMQGADGCLTSNLNLCCPWQGLPSTLYSLVGYDSRGNKTTVTDPKLNVVISLYDGASRLVETQQEMRQNGDGRNAPDVNQTFLTPGGIIRTEYVYDGNSRLVELVDDRGASTVYRYDLIDRLVTKQLADGSVSTRVYDMSSCLTRLTDENGTVFAFTYDALSRKTSMGSTPAIGSGVVSIGIIYYLYDGLSRSVQYQGNSGSSTVQYVYDSINRTLEEYQAGGSLSGVVVLTEFRSYVPTIITYPNTITATQTYDALYRRITVAGANGPTALENVSWQFFGPNRLVETVWGDGSLIATQMNNTRTHSAVQKNVPLPEWGDASSDRLGYDGAGR